MAKIGRGGTEAQITLVDGSRQPVYEDERGQYVVNDDGPRVHGVWYIRPEECDVPNIVDPRLF